MRLPISPPCCSRIDVERGAIIGPLPPWIKRAVARKPCSLRTIRKSPNMQRFLVLRRQCCQRAQRLSKTLHRDHPDSPCVLAGLFRVIPSRHKEDVHARAARADRLLLHAADRLDRPVRVDLSGRRDLVAAGRRRGPAPRACRARTRAPRTGRRSSRRRSSPGTAASPARPGRRRRRSPAASGRAGRLDRPRADLFEALARRGSSAARSRPACARAIRRPEVGGRPHGPAVDRDDHVGRLEAGLGRGRAGQHVRDQRTVGRMTTL